VSKPIYLRILPRQVIGKGEAGMQRGEGMKKEECRMQNCSHSEATLIRGMQKVE
jgi:hypothetical protein